VPDTRDIVDELTSGGARLNLGGADHGPSYPIARLLSTVVSMFAEFKADLARPATSGCSRPGSTLPPRRPDRAKAKAWLRGNNPKREVALVALLAFGTQTALELAEMFDLARSTVHGAVQGAGMPPFPLEVTRGGPIQPALRPSPKARGRPCCRISIPRHDP